MLLNGISTPCPLPQITPKASNKAWFPEQILIPFLHLPFLTFGNSWATCSLSAACSSRRKGWSNFPIYCAENEEADTVWGRGWRCVCLYVCVWAFLAPLLWNNIGNADDSAWIESRSSELAFLYSLLFTKNVLMPSITDFCILHFLLKAFYFKKNKPQASSLPFLKLSSLAVDAKLWTSFFWAQRTKLEGNEHLSKAPPCLSSFRPFPVWSLCLEVGQVSNIWWKKAWLMTCSHNFWSWYDVETTIKHLLVKSIISSCY